MFERTTWILWSAIIALTFISFGEAHAENLTIAANGHNDVDVIEEIVVVGNKKKRRLSPDRILVTRPTIERPSHFDLQLLPVYDPGKANGRFSAVQQHEQLRRVGIITLFRLNFGR